MDFLASGSDDSTARIWDMVDSTPTSSNPLVLKLSNEEVRNDSFKNFVTSMDWNYNGTLLATGHYDYCARIWNRFGSLMTTVNLQKGLIYALKWNKSGSYILTTSFDKTTIIWDWSTGKCIQKFSFHSARVLDIDWLTNTSFASCSRDMCIYVCELNNKNPVRSFKRHNNEVCVIKWDPQGNFLASGSDDSTVKIWSMKQDTFVHDLQVSGILIKRS